MDPGVLALVVIGHVGGLILLYYLGKKCCCRGREGPSVQASELQRATVDNLQPRKQLSTAYLLWAFCGAGGAHHFYCGRYIHGVLVVWTFNFAGIGWFIDGLLIPYYLRSFNGSHAGKEAPNDGSSRRLLCRLPITIIGGGLFVAAFALYFPSFMNYIGVVDLDRRRAQTTQNPYDVLGVPRYADLTVVKAGYRKQSLRWHPDRNSGCGKECDDKMADVGKAYESIKKRNWDDTAHLEGAGMDWMELLQFFLEPDSDGAKDKDSDRDKSEL